MTKTITRLFDTHTQAMSAVTALEAAGVDHERISIISSNADNWHDGHRHDGEARSFESGLDGRAERIDADGGLMGGMGDRAERAAGGVGDLNRDGENDVAEGAGTGAVAGGLLGGGAGALTGLGLLAIPGVGPVVAGGWLAATAVGALVGAAAGGATGGLLGALKEAGHSDADAHVYAEGVRRGGTLVSVRADEADAGRIEALLNDSRGVDAAARGEAYRAAGWTGFDDTAAPYTREEVTRERATYGEARSFAREDTVAIESDDVVSDIAGGPRPSETGRSF
jgi:hypothetical protein